MIIKKIKPRRLKFYKCYFSKSVTLFTALSLLTAPITFTWGVSNSTTVGVMKALDTVGNSVLQVLNQNAAIAQNQSLINSLTPQRVQDPYFGCPLTAARSNFPQGACRSRPDPTPNDYQMAQTIKQIASQYEVLYDKMATKSQNSPFPEGLQCIENARAKLSSQLNDRIQALEDQAAQMKKRAQLFRDINQQILDGLKSDNELLNGGGTDLAAQGRDLRKMFSSEACNESLSDDVAKAGSSLRSLSASFTEKTSGDKSLRKASADFNRDQKVISKHIKKQVNRMKKDIKRMGIERWLASSDKQLQSLSRGGVTPFPGLKEAVDRQKEVFDTELSDIKSKLTGVGYTLPTMDKNFKRNVKRFSKGFQGYFKKKFVTECAESFTTGGGLTANIQKELQAKAARKSGRNYKDYLNDLNAIMSEDSFIEDKAAAIEGLDAKYGGVISIGWQEGGEISNKTPSQIYKQQITVCNQKFTQNDSFSTDSSKIGTSSQSAQLSEAKEELERAKVLEESIVGNLEDAMLDKILKCDGNASTRSGNCNAEALSTSNPNFCIPTATKCAANIQSCYKQIEQKVQETENKMKQKQNLYNKNLRELVTAQESALQTIKNEVIGTGNFLKQYFKGAEFEFPKDLFVKMPEMKDSPFGVKLLNGGNLDFLEKELPAQILKLKEKLALQKEKVTGPGGAIAEYMKEQEQAINDNKAKWAKLKSECDAIQTTFETNQRTQQQQAQEAFQKSQENINEFCHKYNTIYSADSPVAGCDGASSPESLQSDVSKVAAHLDGSVVPAINAYRNLCAKFNANGTETTSSKDERPLIEQYCDNTDKFKKDALKKLSGDNKTKAEESFKEIEGAKGYKAEAKLKSSDVSDMNGRLKDLKTTFDGLKFPEVINKVSANKTLCGTEKKKVKIPESLSSAKTSELSSDKKKLDELEKQIDALILVKSPDCFSEADDKKIVEAKKEVASIAKKLSDDMEATEKSGSAKTASACKAYTLARRAYIKTDCATEKEGKSKCRSDAAKDFEREPESEPSGNPNLSEIKKMLTSVQNGATSGESDDLLKRWQAIGQKSKGACAAQASTGINTGLQGFDDITTQQGANLAPSAGSAQ